MKDILLVDYDINSIYVAITSLVISFITGIFTYIFTKRKDKEIELLRQNIQKEKDEGDARRDYEYEAKKRLYQKFEPLLFQFNELGENSLKRIIGFARESNNGNLADWLYNTNGYYFVNSIYRIFAPLSIFKLMQEDTNPLRS